mmetsp:Transcript_23247/g.75160  ORF Transcript_23247/g.75160 Transcript_23247/m.75160 type:complete len:1662 (-) Transcript_23247:649-5634(-)
MALTVESLLAAESSSEDEESIAAPARLQAAANAAASPAVPAVGGGEVAAAGGAEAAGAASAARATPPVAGGPSGAAAPAFAAPPIVAPSASAAASRPLTIAEAMAQGDDSDSDQDVARPPPGAAHAAAAKAPLAPGPPLRVARSLTAASADTDALSEDADTPGGPAGMKAVGLAEVMAMADSSDEEAAPLASPSFAPTSAAAVAAAVVAPQVAAAAAAVAGGAVGGVGAAPSSLAEGDRGEDPPGASEGVAVFARAPWAWSAEHEKSLLLHNVEEPSTVLAGDSNEAPTVAGLSMVEVRQCSELRRMLAQEFGLPTCVFAHARLVGVGSLRGVVVLLDPQLQDVPSQPQALCPPGNEEAVAVTAGAFSADASSVIVGHKNGHVALWDLSTRKIAASVKDVHSTAVVSIVFCRSSWQYALSADAAGNVLLLTFTSTLGRRRCQATMLLGQSSNIGITLRILPLPQLPSQGGNPTDSLCLVALCATNATVLLTLHPSVQVLQKMQYNTKDAVASWIPDAAWMRVSPSDLADSAGAARSREPILCIAFGQTLHMMRVSFTKQDPSTKEDFKISLVGKYRWGSLILGVTALNESVLALLDHNKKLSILQLPVAPDPAASHSGAEGGKGVAAAATGAGSEALRLVPVHTEDVSGLSLVYHMNTSVDGSRDARSHHGAFAVFQGRSRTLYACGMKQVWALQIGRWGQKVEELVQKNEWSAALEIFLALRKGTLPPLLDFPHPVAARQKAVDSRTTQVIQSYLVNRLLPDSPRAQARQMAGCAVSACIEMRLWSVLYKTVFECFKVAGHMNVYCSTLEPFIVNGRIPRSQMDSEVLSSILQSYALPLEEESLSAEQHFKDGTGGAEPLVVDCDHCPELFPIARRLQQLVLYVEVTQLDLNLAIRLFTQHRLWTALVHIYCALGDYASPVELLVGECTQLAKRCLLKANASGDADAAQAPEPTEERPFLQCLLVRKLFFFLHRTFELRAFPCDSKEVPGLAHPGPKAIVELLRCILRADGPIFTKLLRLSPLGLFTGFASLFTSPSANHALASQASADGPCVLGADFHPLTPANVFKAIEAALERARRHANEDGLPLPANTDSEFLWFLARSAPRAGLGLPAARCMEVVEHLLASAPGAAAGAPPRGGGVHFGCHSSEEAEQLLIGLLGAKDPFAQREERERFAARAARVGFLGAAAWLHERHGEHGKALDCRLQDGKLREGVFEYIITRLAEASDDAAGSAALVEATLQRLLKLVELDAERCAVLVCEQFANVADHSSVLQRLRGYPKMELQYLETLLVRRKLGHWKDSDEHQRFFDAHVVRYVELLCTHSPTAVLPFIMENEALPLRECLELCRRFDVTDASIHLLERTGDFPLVLKLLLGDYSAALEKLHGTFAEPPESARPALARVVKRLSAIAAARGQDQGSKEASEARWWEGLPDARRCVGLLEQASEMSARNSNIMTEAQLEELWFGLLRRTVRWQEQVAVAQGAKTKRQVGMASAFEELVSQAMAGLLAFLSLPRSLKWICEEFGPSRLGIWRGPVRSLLSGLNFQLGLLCAAKAVAAQDVVKPFSAVKHRGSRGLRLAPGDLADAAAADPPGDAGRMPGEAVAAAALTFVPAEVGGLFKVRLAGTARGATDLAERLTASAGGSAGRSAFARPEGWYFGSR